MARPTAKKVPAKKAKQDPGNKANPAFIELFKDGIRDLYWAELHLTKALPKMQKAASSGVLANAFAEHLEITRGHAVRLEEIFGLLEEQPRAKKCDAMEGLVKEGEAVIEDTDEGTDVRDAGLILAAQKVEHYEIAAYKGLARLANTLGLEAAAQLLEETLTEEEEADQKLSGIAETEINYSAVPKG